MLSLIPAHDPLPTFLFTLFVTVHSARLHEASSTLAEFILFFIYLFAFRHNQDCGSENVGFIGIDPENDTNKKQLRWLPCP